MFSKKGGELKDDRMVFLNGYLSTLF